MSDDDQHVNHDADKAPYKDGPKDEHSEFVAEPATPTDQDAPGAQTGLGAGTTGGATDPDAGGGERDEDVDQPAGGRRAEASRSPRGAPPA